MSTNGKPARKSVSPRSKSQRLYDGKGTKKRGYRPIGSKPPIPTSDSKVTSTGEKK